MIGRTITRVTAATFAGAVVTMGAVATPASAQTQQDGLINVSVGNVNVLNDANIGVAADVAATICGVDVGPVAILGQAVDTRGGQRVVCRTEAGPVRLAQN